VTVRVFSLEPGGHRYPAAEQTGFGPFLFALRAASYEVAALGRTQSVTLQAGALSTVTMGYAGVCTMR